LGLDLDKLAQQFGTVLAGIQRRQVNGALVVKTIQFTRRIRIVMILEEVRQYRATAQSDFL
jgi:hypothetical protein